MKILTFLFIASALIVYEAQSIRLFKRDLGQPVIPFLCKNCDGTFVLTIKCGNGYNSVNAPGCALFYTCKPFDDSTTPSSYPPDVTPSYPPGSPPPQQQPPPQQPSPQQPSPQQPSPQQPSPQQPSPQQPSPQQPSPQQPSPQQPSPQPTPSYPLS